MEAQGRGHDEKGNRGRAAAIGKARKGFLKIIINLPESC